MKIDITSLFFNAKIENRTATAAWSTSIGQNTSNECRIEDDTIGVNELLVGMLYKSISPNNYGDLDLSKMSEKRDILLISRFDKIFVNGKHLKDCSFILIYVKEHTPSHEGRLLISYPRYVKENEQTFNNMRDAIGCSNTGAWFVNEINVYNQDELHFNAIVVDSDNSKIYPDSETRKKEWKNLTFSEKQNKTLSIDELAQSLNECYTKAQNGKQMTMLYMFIIEYGAYLVDKITPNELVKKAELKDSLSAEINKAYNIYRHIKKFGLGNCMSNVQKSQEAKQIIYFGAPGTGKSHKIKELNLTKNNSIRTTDRKSVV